MPRGRGNACSYSGCEEEAQYILELDGRLVPICKTHFKNIIKKLEARAAEVESSSLSELDTVEGEEGIRLLSRKAVSRGRWPQKR